MEKILRNRDGDTGPDRREGRIRHDVVSERLDVTYSRVFAPSTVRPELVVHLGLERDAQALDAYWFTVTVEENPHHRDA
jgi:hypothetical protein